MVSELRFSKFKFYMVLELRFSKFYMLSKLRISKLYMISDL